MVQCGENTGIPIEVFGPETHLTSVVSYALGKKSLEQIVAEQKPAQPSIQPAYRR